MAGARRSGEVARVVDGHGRQLPPGVRGKLHPGVGQAARWGYDGRIELLDAAEPAVARHGC
ncbi:hypothetical protein JQS43_10075 [Natronosporangium hydrolyticum]|uniref:Uncharacterized protein n=1 Tax=Natronosporangium hydrolyticum TaxID=2811111 RepID=A0A895YKN5_9ACTN|nr:hypothetical protein [Natronosporangium hydrolyticum]QSB16582.1 hypothetical protein JQS43_10075 [Natronosporangium hydrolyticum]